MTVYIEDLIIDLNSYVNLNQYDGGVVTSFANQIFVARGFTEKQSNLAVKILKKYCAKLELATGKTIAPHLSNPQFRFPVRQSASVPNKRIYIDDHPQWGKCIKAEFPYNEDKVIRIRKNREVSGMAAWDPESKSWNFSLSETNIRFLRDLTIDDAFVYDDEFTNYLNQIDEIIKNIDQYIPMLVLEDGTIKYKNVHQNLPEIDSSSVLASVFSARKSGVSVWDKNINDLLLSYDLNPHIKNFLNYDYQGTFEIDSTKEPIDCLADIVKYMSPCLFVIPGGSELEKTKMVYNFLISQGYTNEQMSVMFRLPSSDGKNFNDFVKNSGLNNPISDDTKFVFVSTKLPKPVLKSKLKFNGVVSLGRSNVHYTVRDFFKNRENLIYYCEPSKQKEFSFGNL